MSSDLVYSHVRSEQLDHVEQKHQNQNRIQVLKLKKK